MSGRLVILRHKSWHVWNQDNREKVLRDERIHREKLETEKAKETQSNADYTFELLKSKVHINAEAKEDDTTAVIDIKQEKFCLFDDPAIAMSKKDTQNSEYVREQTKKAHAEQRAQGVAPLALGDVSSGLNPSLPWYIDTSEPQQSSRKSADLDQLAHEEKLRVMKDRELKRKRKQDPMQSFVKYSNDSATECRELLVKTRKLDDNRSSGSNNDLDMALLRKKRLEREAAERKKASILLADPHVNEKFRISSQQQYLRR